MLKDADGSYRVYLDELIAFGNSAEQIDKDRLGIDSDVFTGEIDDEYSDLDRRSMGSVGEEEEEEDYDPDIKMLLQNLKPCGFAYVLDIPSFTEQRKYEVEDEFKQPDEPRRKVPKSNPEDRTSQLKQKRSHVVKELRILDNEVKRMFPTYGVKNTKSAQKKSANYSSTYNKRKSSYKEKNEAPTLRRSSRKSARKSLVEDSSSDYLQEEPIQHHSHVLPNNRQELQKEYPPVKHSQRKRGKERVQTSLSEDYSKLYLKFLRGSKLVGDSPRYADENGKKYMYEESSDESLSDSDVVLAPPTKRMTPKPSKKRLHSSENNRLAPEPSKKRCLSSGKKGPTYQNVVIDPSSKYRKMLMEVLLKPYDKEEHHDLWKMAKRRRPKMHHRDMHGANRAYAEPQRVDLSFLDQYHALNTAIKAVQPDEPHKVLHLLRGLELFLTYELMEDQFIPWNDKSWMKAVSKSKYQ